MTVTVKTFATSGEAAAALSSDRSARYLGGGTLVMRALNEGDISVSTVVRATDQARRKQLADEIQKVAFSEVPYVPWGEWFQPTAFRKSVHDVLKFDAPIFWNVKVA